MFASFIKRNFRIPFRTFWYLWRKPKDPNEFTPVGSQIFYGMQGEGKTISMVYYSWKLRQRYPRAVLVTNLDLKNYEGISWREGMTAQDIDPATQYFRFEEYNQLVGCLRNIRNGKHGVIFMIDEIHNYFHSHDSKSMPMWIVQVFSQQRKQKLIVLGTVQDWEDVIKAIRRQIQNLIACKKIGLLFVQSVFSPRDIEKNYGEEQVNVQKRGFFFATKQLMDSFDTYQVVDSGREIIGGGEEPKPMFKLKSKKGFGTRRNPEYVVKF